ncbi:hypothetical protein ACQY0O_002551 [Thecaphora frezii]
MSRLPSPPLSRYRRSTALALILVLLSLLAVPLVVAKSVLSENANGGTLQGCLLEEDLKVISPTLSDAHTYHEASKSNNVVYHYNPAAIVYPTSTKQVQAAVRCAAHDGSTAVAARSGGHSFGAYGSGGRDGTLVIDLGGLNQTFSNPKQRTAEIWAGARLGDVVKDLWTQRDGKMAMAHGTCPTVGIGGHSICGGVGPTSRKWGMTADHILEADVVLANGSMVTASETQNAELLWAIKGAGSYMGIVTRFLFRTHEASQPTVFFEYRWSPSIRAASDAARIFMAVQAFAQSPAATEEFGFHVQIIVPRSDEDDFGGGHPLAIHVRGSYLGAKATFDEQVARLWREVRRAGAPMPDRRTERETTYLATMQEWDDFGTVGHELDTQLERKIRNNFIAKTTLTLDHRKGFQQRAFAALCDEIWDRAKVEESETILADGSSSPFLWNIYFEFYGGASPAFRSKAARQGSSFPWRDGTWLIQVSVGAPSHTRLPHGARVYLAWLNGRILKAIKRSGLEMAGYSCYLDPDLDEREWRWSYYGDSIRRLEKLKAQLDPNNLLRNPQSLGTRSQIEARWKKAARH